MSEEDGRFLEKLLIRQQTERQTYPVDEEEYQKQLPKMVRRTDKLVAVTVPHDDDEDGDDAANGEKPAETPDKVKVTRESAKMQALVASCGEKMGYSIWIPKNDRQAVLREWTPEDGSLLGVLPLNYDETTLQTIEQIDVLWLKNRSIVRAFEVEHTTAVYSGILRMADLLALQPNMDIKLHIVAPDARQDKVFSEIRRPVFSLLEKGPLSECCTFLPYSSLQELSKLSHLRHLSDSVLEEYEESAE